jgi:hypothetical protein
VSSIVSTMLTSPTCLVLVEGMMNAEILSTNPIDEIFQLAQPDD